MLNVEKNWSPFVFNGTLHFVRMFDPLQVLRCTSGPDGRDSGSGGGGGGGGSGSGGGRGGGGGDAADDDFDPDADPGAPFKAGAGASAGGAGAGAGASAGGGGSRPTASTTYPSGHPWHDKQHDPLPHSQCEIVHDASAVMEGVPVEARFRVGSLRGGSQFVEWRYPYYLGIAHSQMKVSNPDKFPVQNTYWRAIERMHLIVLSVVS